MQLRDSVKQKNTFDHERVFLFGGEGGTFALRLIYFDTLGSASIKPSDDWNCCQSSTSTPSPHTLQSVVSCL